MVVSRHCLVQSMLGTGVWGWVIRWVAVETQEALGLVLAHWHVELSLGVASCGVGNPRDSVAFRWVGLVPDMISCRDQGDLELVTSH